MPAIDEGEVLAIGSELLRLARKTKPWLYRGAAHLSAYLEEAGSEGFLPGLMKLSARPALI